MTIREMDVRVSKASQDARKDKAATASYRFIRRQVEAEGVSDKVELARRMWELFFVLEKTGLLAAPIRTKTLLRERLAFYRSVGVDGSVVA